MKQIKIALFILVCIVLTGCTQEEKELTVDEIFKEDLRIAYEISSEEGKKILEDISVEKVKDIMKDIDANITYKEITQGIANDENNVKTACVKLPVDIKLIGNEEEIKGFITDIHEMDNRISVGDINISKVDEEYEIDLTVNFFGKMKAENLKVGNSSVSSNVQVVEGKKDEANEVTLRDFNVFMILRPSNSDAASVTLEFKNNESVIMYDNNEIENISIDISKEEGKYFCLVKSDEINEKIEIKNVGNKIVMDILSCEKKEKTDMVGVNLEVNNLSGKKADIVIYEDSDKRVNIKTSGDVEVKNK